MIEKYISEYISYQLSDKDGINKERTLDKYVMCIKEFIEIMNIKTINEIDDLTWIDIRQYYINNRKEILGSQSINLRISALRSFFNFLVGKRLIKENVVNNIKKEKTQKRDVEVDMNKLKNLLLLVDDEYKNKPCYLTIRNKMIINMLLFLGLRNEELRSIRINDISFSDGKFKTNNSKNNKSRQLYLPKKLSGVYREYLSYRNIVDTESDLLFLSKTGKPLGKNAVTEMVKKESKKVDLDYVAHSCRHCTVTLLIMSGVPIEEVSIILGHSSINVTQAHYHEVVTSEVKSNINKNLLLEVI